MRDGARYFLQPGGISQRRYEAMRAYFVEAMPASAVATQFGYSIATVHQMATLLRSGRMSLFADARPGPKGTRKTGRTLRTRVLKLRAAGHSVTEISAALTSAGLPVSAQTVWQILDAEGIPRLPRSQKDRHRLPAASRAGRPRSWPTRPLALACKHAGLLLMLPGMAELRLPELVGAAGYPSAQNMTCWQAIGTLMMTKCAPRAALSIASDPGLAYALGLTALPSPTDQAAYSGRVDRVSNRTLLASLVKALRPLGLATGDAGFNCDFHRVRRTGFGLAFYAQDHASGEIIYASTDIGRMDRTRQIVGFADYWREATRTNPGLLVFDSQLTTYSVLEELADSGLHWLCPRLRGPAELARLAALPGSEWQALDPVGPDRYRQARLHEDLIKLKGVACELRQIAVTGAVGTKPVLLITNDYVTPARDLFIRHTERLAAAGWPGTSLNASRLDARRAGAPVNVDLDTTLVIILGNLYRLLARQLADTATASLGGHWWRFLDIPGTLNITKHDLTCALEPRQSHPALTDMGLADLEIPIPWWENRTLRFSVSSH